MIDKLNDIIDEVDVNSIKKDMKKCAKGVKKDLRKDLKKTKKQVNKITKKKDESLGKDLLLASVFGAAATTLFVAFLKKYEAR